MRRLLGYVSVDSGVLVIVDPSYVSGDKEVRPYGTIVPLREDPIWEKTFMPVLKEGKQLGTGGWGSAVVFPTGVGDGIFPVYLEDGRVIIDLQDWCWAHEGSKELYPAISIGG